jgi:SNF family Na+-dependent transporter
MLIIFSLGVCIAIGYKIPKKGLAVALNVDEASFIFVLWFNLIRFVVPFFILVVAFSRLGAWL